MSLIHPTILFGLGLTVIPIILHFMLRAKPKVLPFPALQLIQLRKKTNVRRMRLRHLWLLLLRILVIVLIVVAIARPSLPAANYWLTNGEMLRLAGIVVFAVVGYIAAVRFWRKKNLPQHSLAYRRALLRGGLGVSTLILLLLLVAWPYSRRIAAEYTAPATTVAENIPVTGVFLFDTSVSMEYRAESQTRLEVTQEIATKHLASLPSGSRICVSDNSSNDPLLFHSDPLARIANLKISATHHMLNERVRSAILFLEEEQKRAAGGEANSVADSSTTQDTLNEIYIFTDLAKSAWQLEGDSILKSELGRLPGIHVYLIDVGVEKPMNVGISEIRFSRQVLSRNEPLTITTTIAATGLDEEQERVVELRTRDSEGNTIKLGQQSVIVGGNANLLQPDEPVESVATFTTRGLTREISHAEVALISSDPLPKDDLRFLTVQVKPPPRILAVAESRLAALFWMQALAPEELVKMGRQRYDVVYRNVNKLDDTEFTAYEAVCLVGVKTLSENAWNRLTAYVSGGGGLAVLLGANGRTNPQVATSYNSVAAQKIMPAQLLADLSFSPSEFLDLRRPTHPLVRKLVELGGGPLLSAADILRFWRVEPHEDATEIARYSDQRSSAAIVERVVGKGRSILLTTAVDRSGWNDLVVSGWAYVVFADQMMQYLAQRADIQRNFVAGAEVVIPFSRSERVNDILLRKPKLQQVARPVPASAEAIVIRDTSQAGHYNVVARDIGSDFSTGFSTNHPGGESRLTRLSSADLDELIGAERYALARDVSELTRQVGRGRIGQEMVPYIVLILLLFFIGEHLVANFFYDEGRAAQQA